MKREGASLEDQKVEDMLRKQQKDQASLKGLEQ
jgi:hypothetical protein